MTNDDDDDDVVVPAGSRRSSYVPPPVDGEFIPTLPPVPEQESPTSSTGQVPSIGAIADEHVAQVPVFAESIEVPRIEQDSVGSIVIEVPVDDSAADSATRDEYGLPLVADPIDIPQVIVTDPLPDAVSGTGTDTVFDDNRFFPPAVEPVRESESELEAVSVSETAEESTRVPEPELEPGAEPGAEPELNAEPTASVHDYSASDVSEHTDIPTLPSLPSRQSLTPNDLSAQLAAGVGMSSNEQMALLDAQIPLREIDTAAITQFVGEIGDRRDEPAMELLREAASLFGDLLPELTRHSTPAAENDHEFTDDSTPVTGIPLGELVDTPDLGESVAEPAASLATPSAVGEDDQSWSLAAPADVVVTEEIRVGRRRWFAIVAFVATLVSLLTVAVGMSVSTADAAPSMLVIALSVLIASPLAILARRASALTGASIRAVTEELFGTFVGRVVVVIVAVLSTVIFSVAVGESLTGLGAQIESSEGLAPFLTTFASGSLGHVLAAVVAVVGAVIAALPHRAFRAFSLMLVGLTTVGSAAVVAMGSALLILSSEGVSSLTDPQIAAGGFAGAIALVLLTVSMFGFSEVSRIREQTSGAIWIWVGLGLGVVVATGAVVSALLAADGTHYFFGLNPVIHIIAPSPVLSVLLGASALLPALVTLATLVFRFVSSTTTREDRDDAHPAIRWVLVGLSLVLGALAFVGFTPNVMSALPNVAVLAPPVGVTVGIMAARGLVRTSLTSTSARIGLSIIWVLVLAVALGYASSSGETYEWLGFINGALAPLGYGLLYIDVVAPVAAALVSFILALFVVVPSVRRSNRNA